MSPSFIVVDLECTCHARGEEPAGFVADIIEVGAVHVDSEQRCCAGEYHRVVRPEPLPTLSAFCTTLTSLGQQDIEAGTPLPQVLCELRGAVDPAHTIFASWGFFDKRQIEAAAQRCGSDSPFPRSISLKHELAVFTGSGRVGLARGLEQCGLEPCGTPHRALDDARSAARILLWLLERGWQPDWVSTPDFRPEDARRRTRARRPLHEGSPPAPAPGPALRSAAP